MAKIKDVNTYQAHAKVEEVGGSWREGDREHRRMQNAKKRQEKTNEHEFGGMPTA